MYVVEIWLFYFVSILSNMLYDTVFVYCIVLYCIVLHCMTLY